VKKWNLKNSSTLFLVIALFTMLLLPTISVYAKSNDQVVEKVYKNEQIDNETLIEMAKHGQLVNNYHTQTKFKDGEMPVVEIKKTLSEEIVNNEVVKKHMMSVQSVEISKKALEENMNSQSSKFDAKAISINKLDSKLSLSGNASLNKNVFKSLYTGSKSITANDGSVTVRMTTVMYYDTYYNNGITHYRITRANYVSTLLDSTFRLYSINSDMGEAGSGYYYDSTGKYYATVYKEVRTTYSKSYPTSGVPYDKYTGFTFFVNVSEYSGGGVNSSLSYQRASGGTVYKLTLPHIAL